VATGDHRLLSWLERITKYITFITVILLFLMVFWGVAVDLWRRPIMLDPLIVPKSMEDQGYTGEAAANRVVAEIALIQKAATTPAPRSLFSTGDASQLPDIEIPETKLSVRSAINLVEDLLRLAPLRLAPPHITAEVIFPSGDQWYRAATNIAGSKDFERVYICIRKTGDSSPHWVETTAHNPDQALTLVARGDH